ncbi:MAG: general secretion pathway protein GspB [Proteobacteria bacterium]|nr:general secretion pathway protein GspB [Pseudomonadota bacterium]MBU4296633.1 general secretion pathway protein GspB [Pseudomonadota bacterium]MCG2748262.1 general secretion pathway protein GspB [Desulfobulbaceae bacterium]
MSYILDALKKSDKQRQQARVPDLNTAPQELAPQKKKKAWWPLALAAIVLVNVIFILFFVTRQKQPATETQAIVHSPGQAQQETVQERRKAIAPQATPGLSPVSPEPRQAEPAAAEDESTVAGMAEDDTASRQEPAAATPMSQGEIATGTPLQEDAHVEDTRESGSEVADMAPQSTPGLSPVSPAPQQSEPAAAEDESTVAGMAEDDIVSLQDHAAATPMSHGEIAADPQLQEDAYAEDTRERGSEVANMAPLEDADIAGKSLSPATATHPEQYYEKPEPDQPQRPGLVETADSGPIEPKDSLMKKALHIEQLPRAIREQLPDIHISAHLFYENKPASRFASINGKVLREGQMLAPDLKVAEISTDGVIFRYQKYLFYVSVF